MLNLFLSQLFRIMTARSIALVCLVTLLGGMHPGAWATAVIPVTEHDLVTQAELIFEGVVERVEYRLSNAPSKGALGVPHTFVTFRIAKVFKGVSENKNTITLRFLGGPRTQSTYLKVDGVPLFDPGDRDILFVTGNGIRACPLVGWYQGRFRVWEGEVYSDSGRSITFSEVRRLAFGKRHTSEFFRRDRIGVNMLTRVYSPEVSEDGKVAAPSQPVSSLSYKRFTEHIASLVAALHPEKLLGNLQPVKSVNINEDFSFQITPARTPATTLQEVGPGSSSDRNKEKAQ